MFFFSSECTIRTDEVLMNNGIEETSQAIVHLNGLQLNVDKGTEVSVSNTIDGRIRRIFK
jgi:hypothetical protein